MFLLTSGFLKSKYLYFNLTSSFVSLLKSISKGICSALEDNNSNFSHTTSIKPVGNFSLIVSSSLLITSPSTFITVSFDTPLSKFSS